MATTPVTKGALSVTADVRQGEYGAKVAAVEPGGAEFIPLSERHGTPLNLFWTWTSPNLEFATVFLGVLAVAAFGQSLPAAVAAIVLGTALGSVTQGLLSARGPELGVAQMIVSRIPFGFRGNILPAGLNAVVAGIGWFAVNSVSGAFALNALFGLPALAGLLIVVVAQVTIAFLGHNFIHTFEKWALPLLGLVFLVTCVTIAGKSHPSLLAANPKSNVVGAFLLTFGTTFGYAAGWNPYATDYTRYLPPTVSKKLTGLYAGLGIFVSCTILEIAGALSVSLVKDPFTQPTAAFTSSLPGWLAKLTLLAIAVGAVSANAINVYSGAMSFLALGIKIPLHLARAIVAAAFSVLGFLLAASGLDDAGHKYEAFLLIIAYWIGPWLAVMFADQWLRRGHRVDGFGFDRSHNPFAGWIAMLAGIVVSIWLFSNQEDYTGPVPQHFPAFGDFTFEVGFALAAVLYFLLFRLQRDATDELLVVPE
jgi:NCS1 nucleoside transporter family